MKIAVVTPYFPTNLQTYRGYSAYQTLKLLQQWAEVEVLCPLATYPNWLQPRNFPYSHADLNYHPPHIKTQYFEYPAVPGITRPVNGAVCAHYLEPRLRRARADLVLNYWLYPEGYAAVRVAHKLGLPAVVCSIGSDLNSIPDPITAYFVRCTLRTADFVLTVSKQLAERAIRLGASVEKVRSIMNGCDSTVFYPADRGRARAQLSIPPDAPVILFVGRLEAAKGVFELLHATRTLLRSRPNLCLVYVGEGNARPPLQAEVTACQMAQHVTFAGTCESATVAQWLAASTVFSLPSYAEGCPNVVIEALNCGRPIVATTVGAIPEMVEADSGILVPPRDSKALTLALATALDRVWDEHGIALHCHRTWDEVASDTLAACEVALRRYTSSTLSM
jgi:glycosyltransferase involved in cell wall biosynthesis